MPNETRSLLLLLLFDLCHKYLLYLYFYYLFVMYGALVRGAQPVSALTRTHYLRLALLRVHVVNTPVLGTM